MSGSGLGLIGGPLKLVALLAFGTHMWYQKAETKSIMLVLITSVLCPVPSAFLLHSTEEWGLAKAYIYSLVWYIALLIGSITVYRLSPLHPLSSYPGPRRGKITKLWGAWVAYRGKPQVYYSGLHKRYGPVVRVGPNELSITEAELIPQILGSQGMPKGPMWEGRRILPSKNYNVNNSLTAVRDLKRHAQLRKPWNNAFKQDSLARYEPMLVKRGAQLVDILERKCQEEKKGSDGGIRVDLAMWINYFSMDFMGDFAFGGVYSLMTDGDTDGILPTIRRGVFLPSISQHVPWLSKILRHIPFLGRELKAFGAFGVAQAKKRMQVQAQAETKDLCHHLLEAAEPGRDPQSVIVSSTLLAIVAGSDTTSAALCNIMYYLLRNPRDRERLRQEIDEVYPPATTSDTITPIFLNAIVNETLRLQPSVPSGLQRAPALGSGEQFLRRNMSIPEGTSIIVPPYAMHRDPRYFFPYPEKFWPGRWLDEKDKKGSDSAAGNPEIVLDRDAFMPFSYGPAGCPGKPLAMIELRYVTCLLVRTFDMEFDDGYDPEQWEEGLVDRYIMLKGALPVKIKLRKVHN